MIVQVELTPQELTAMRILVVTTISDYLDSPLYQERDIYQYCSLRRFYNRVFLTHKITKVKLWIDEYLALISVYQGKTGRDEQLVSAINKINIQATAILKFIPNELLHENRTSEISKETAL